MRAGSARGVRASTCCCSGRRHGARGSGGSVVMPSRAQLCGEIKAAHGEKEELRSLTSIQRRELAELDDECKRLRASVAEADLARAGLACESCSSRCVADVGQLELRQLQTERRRLEQELETWRSGASRLKHASELREKQEAERLSWEQEKRRLEHEMALARSQLVSYEDAAKHQAAEMVDIARQQAVLKALEEDLQEQRKLREEADAVLRSTLAELDDVRIRRGGAMSTGLRSSAMSGASLGSLASASLVEAERARVIELRLRLTREGDERQRHASQLQTGLNELDALRQELQHLTADNAQLRAGLQRSLHGLERIERHSSDVASVVAPAAPTARPFLR